MSASPKTIAPKTPSRSSIVQAILVVVAVSAVCLLLGVVVLLPSGKALPQNAIFIKAAYAVPFFSVAIVGALASVMAWRGGRWTLTRKLAMLSAVLVIPHVLLLISLLAGGANLGQAMFLFLPSIFGLPAALGLLVRAQHGK